MISLATHKGYSARIEWDRDDEIYFGHIDGIHDIVGFHADKAEKLPKLFREAVDDYIECCAEMGKSPETPCTAQAPVRAVA